jgi:rhamnosyltransferase
MTMQTPEPVEAEGGEVSQPAALHSRQVVAVVVSYQPSSLILSNIGALLPQVRGVVVVDNGTTGQARRYLDELAPLPGVHLIANDENLGIAAALNQGASAAGVLGAEWILTMDQDSTAPAGLVAELLAARDDCEGRANVAIVAPRYRDAGTGVDHSFSRPADVRRRWTPIEMTITSGNLVNLEVLDRIGGFDEALFIDYVDMDLCLRLRRAGYDIIEAGEAVLLHRLGAATRHRFLGREIAATHHSALRRYYISRNRVALYRRFARSRPGWVARDLYSWAREIVKIVSFEAEAGAKLHAMGRGVWHGIRGRMGRFEG